MKKLKQRADGRYRRVVNGITFYGSSEREVNRKILEYTEKKEKGRPFDEVAEEWWKYAWEALSPTSVRGYRVCKEHAVDYFKKMSIKEITPRHITAFMTHLARQQYAKKTVSNHKIVLSQIFKHAIAEGDVMISPVTSTEIPKGLKTKKRRPASTDEETTIRKSAEIWIMPYMALMTGLRKGELLALQWKDINFKTNTISVFKSVYYEGGAHLKDTKTQAGMRTVPLLSDLKEELLKIKGKPNDYVLSGNDKPLSQKRFRTQEKHFKEKTGITCTMHQLRKSFSTIAVNAGVPPKTLQAILGHKQISTTLDIYTEVRKESLLKAAEILNQSFAASKTVEG